MAPRLRTSFSRQMLLRLGFDSIGARTGYEAVDLYREQRASIVSIVLDTDHAWDERIRDAGRSSGGWNSARLFGLSSGYAEPGVVAGVSDAPLSRLPRLEFTLPRYSKRD